MSIQITPETKVGELLDNFPALEATLISISPVFKRLKNPVLRRTVARVATLKQAAAIASIPAIELVNRLRKEAGQSELALDNTHEARPASEPEWLSNGKVSQTFDATPAINEGKSPMADILRKASLLKPSEIMELITPFLPEPILDKLRQLGHEVYSVNKEGFFMSYILGKKDDKH